MNENLIQFLQETIKHELKWMYQYDVNDSAFGIETDKYRWCKQVIEGRSSIESLLDYFSKYYPNDEANFISEVKEYTATL